MQQLSGLDGAFLTMESGTVFGHVGSVCILDTRTARHRLTLRHVTRVIESRLPLVPLFRRRLVAVPFGLDQPYWVDDPDFDIEFHVRSLALPSPGSDAQLAEQVAAPARPAARPQPAAVGALPDHRAQRPPRGDLLQDPPRRDRRGVRRRRDDRRAGPHPGGPPGARASSRSRARRGPGAPWLLGRSAATLATQPLRAARLATELARSVPGLAVAARPLAERIARGHHPALMSGAGLRAPVTPFNGLISAHRRWATADLPLAEVKEVRRGTQLTVNDVVMALCAGTLRRYLAGPRRAAAGSAGGGRAGVRTPQGPGRQLRQQDLADADGAAHPAGGPGRAAAGDAPGAARGQGPARRHTGGAARGRDRVRDAGPGQPGLADDGPAAAVRAGHAVQPDHLQRPGPVGAAVLRRRASCSRSTPSRRSRTARRSTSP